MVGGVSKISKDGEHCEVSHVGEIVEVGHVDVGEVTCRCTRY